MLHLQVLFPLLVTSMCVASMPITFSVVVSETRSHWNSTWCPPTEFCHILCDWGFLCNFFKHMFEKPFPNGETEACEKHVPRRNRSYVNFSKTSFLRFSHPKKSKKDLFEKINPVPKPEWKGLPTDRSLGQFWCRTLHFNHVVGTQHQLTSLISIEMPTCSGVSPPSSRLHLHLRKIFTAHGAMCSSVYMISFPFPTT